VGEEIDGGAASNCLFKSWYEILWDY